MVNITDVKQILQFAIDAEIKVFLDGGWGVDALLGYQSRAHNDIDIFVEKKDYQNFIEMMKAKVFDVSINTLLGSPRKLVCQCCGMPLEDDDIIGHNHDGSFNEDYCKWCYADGTYTYNDMDDLIEVCVKNMVSENFTEEQARSYMKELLPTLDYWKKYDELSDNGQFEEFKKKLINEINELNVDGMPKVEKLNALVGKYVNLEYRLPNGQVVKFLNDAKTYAVEMRGVLSLLYDEKVVE